jgi:hypothetical protein
LQSTGRGTSRSVRRSSSSRGGTYQRYCRKRLIMIPRAPRPQHA